MISSSSMFKECFNSLSDRDTSPAGDCIAVSNRRTGAIKDLPQDSARTFSATLLPAADIAPIPFTKTFFIRLIESKNSRKTHYFVWEVM